MGIYFTLNCFNPTLVRLRPPDWLIQLLMAIVFQSHAGSIEAVAV